MVLLFLNSLNTFDFRFCSQISVQMSICADSKLCLFVMLVISEEFLLLISYFDEFLIFGRVARGYRLYLHLLN